MQVEVDSLPLSLPPFPFSLDHSISFSPPLSPHSPLGSGINNATVCMLGDTRLVNGSKPNEGRVEVCIDNVWGTVCDDRFGPIDGAIACKQLGYSDLGKLY